MNELIITNIKQLVTLRGVAPKKGRHPKESDLSIIEKAALRIKEGKISWLGKERSLRLPRGVKRLDTQQSVCFPGLIDPHTHLLFAGSREHEFAMRTQGASYQEIAQKGGGIASTVKATRKASEKSLIDISLERIQEAAKFGITTLEVKTGYGLWPKNELRLLKLYQKIKKQSPIDLTITLLAAHALPPKTEKEKFVDTVCQKLLPQAAKLNIATFCDVFVEQGYFSEQDAKKILSTGKKYGLAPKLHADQFSTSSTVDLAITFGAISVDHLEHISEKSIRRLAKSDTVAILLPGAAFFLKLSYPPARALIDKGCIVALGTDFNPGSCMTQNLPLMMTFACTQMGMTVPETIAAVTYNAAQALNLNDRGVIEIGKRADLAFFGMPSYEHLPYHFASNHCSLTIAGGKNTTKE